MIKCIHAFLILVSFLLVGCSGEEHTNETIESLANLKVDSDILSDQIPDDTLREIISWTFYEAQFGPQNQHLVMELGVSAENRVTGRYFFSRQQEFLELHGIVDTLSDTLRLRESFQGKITGYMTLFNSEGELNGYRTDELGNQRERISGKKINLSLKKRNQLLVTFNKFEREKNVNIDGDITKLSETETVVDELMLNTLDGRHFSFYYYVAGENGNVGVMEGVATLVEKDYAIFKVPNDLCLLSFRIYPDSVVIEEEEDCSTFRGAQISFTDKLLKIR